MMGSGTLGQSAALGSSAAGQLTNCPGGSPAGTMGVGKFNFSANHSLNARTMVPQKLSLMPSGKKFDKLVSMVVPEDPHLDTHANIGNEASRKAVTDNEIVDAKQLEWAAQMLCSENSWVVSDVEATCRKALGKENVEQKMNARISESQEKIRQLNASIAETKLRIMHTSHSAALTESELKAHETPAEGCNVRDGFRSMRWNHESIRDPVTSIQDLQKSRLQANFDTLSECHSNEYAALRMLQQAKSELETDLADKTAAVNIDLACRERRGFAAGAFEKSPHLTRYPRA